MRPLISLLLMFFLLATVQVGCLYVWRPAPLMPDLLAVLAVQVALHAPKRSAALLVTLIGFLADQLTLTPMGLFTLVYALCGLWLVRIRQEVFRDNPMTYAVFSGMLALSCHGLGLLYFQLVQHAHLPWSTAALAAFGTAGLTAFAALIIAPLLLRWRIGMGRE